MSNESFQATVEAPKAPVTDTAIQNRATVLLVEDSEMVRSVLRTILEKLGYSTLIARDGYEALDVCAGHSGSIQLLITDVIMPQMGGVELAERLKAKYPTLKVLYVSGYSAEETELPDGPELENQFLQKPFTSEVLARKIQEIMVETPTPPLV